MSKELVPQQQALAEVQPVRTINVWNQKDRTEQLVETAAKTWGEFKAELKGEINFKNIRGVVRHNKNILEVDDAILPEEDFSMFLFPQKVKSGMRTRDEYEKTFPTAKALRAECTRRGLGSGGKREDFLDRLVEADKKELDKRGIVTKPPIKSKAVAKASKPETEALAPVTDNAIFPVTIQKAIVTTEMELVITDKNALGDLLAVQFPGMEVVEIEATIALKATLSLGSIVAPPAPVKEAEPVKDEPKAAEPVAEPVKAPAPKKEAKLPPPAAEAKKKKKVVHEKVSAKKLKSEADDMASQFL